MRLASAFSHSTTTVAELVDFSYEELYEAALRHLARITAVLNGVAGSKNDFHLIQVRGQPTLTAQMVDANVQQHYAEILTDADKASWVPDFQNVLERERVPEAADMSLYKVGKLALKRGQMIEAIRVLRFVLDNMPQANAPLSNDPRLVRGTFLTHKPQRTREWLALTDRIQILAEEVLSARRDGVPAALGLEDMNAALA